MLSPAGPRRSRVVPLLLATALTGGAVAAAPAVGGAPLGPAVAAAKTTKKKPAKPAKPKITVESALAALQTAGTVSATDAAAWTGLYRDASAKARALPKGAPRTELLGVLSNTDAIAASGALTADLAPSVFLTLAVNGNWWTTPQPPLANGARPAVVGSPLTWQYYRGEGLQIQWLATFGNANALATTTNPVKLEQLRAIADEALRLASQRAGGPSWQYLFDFGGGKPPWASGMAQVTGMQALVRASGKLGDPRYRATALQAVALLRRAAPVGVRQKQTAGDHIQLYSFTTMRVMNAFTQAVSGLHEVAAATGDGKVASVYVRAERELRAELPRYDLGNWARYSLGGAKETPSYHRLSRDLLRGMCQTLVLDAQAFAAGQPVAGGQPPAPPALYCALGERFAQDLVRTPNGPGSSARARARTAPPAPATPVDAAAELGDPALTRP